MRVGDLLRLTKLRGEYLATPVWARVEELFDLPRYQSQGLMTLVAGGPAVLHLGGARFNIPSRGWAIYTHDVSNSEEFTCFSGIVVPDEFYVDQAKWALLGDDLERK